ncbi:hypothetical protein PCANC_01846 [Puccinia coronata f. sp. avenae]|uniref:Uncharacterized protein n=1 Tax=Puccinia coronata f. sp. avenae TaxID=200324 RepID=A0A2N5W533_9BASI|nr:hypothetical protein PCANC_01846 [Puccinia coronata f. sp. avenae]
MQERNRLPKTKNQRQRTSIYDEQPTLTIPTEKHHSWRTTFSRSTIQNNTTSTTTNTVAADSKASSPTRPKNSSPTQSINNSPSYSHTSFLHNPSFLTIPHSQCNGPSVSNEHRHPNNGSSGRSESLPRKSSSSGAAAAAAGSRYIVDNHHQHPSARSSGRHTPIPGFRSASALSQVSFRSLRSINSRIKVRIQSLGTALEARKPKLPELDWSALRAEYELNLARGSIIERCLVQVDLGPTVSERGRWWIDTVWTLADKLSPPLPAALAQYSAAGLIPLLSPLRHTLHNLALELPYNYQSDTAELDKFEQLVGILRRAVWLAGLIENVIEVVSQVGLVRFELCGLRRPADELRLDNQLDCRFDHDHDNALAAHLDHSIHLISQWSGEIKGRTGSNHSWKGLIKIS